MKKTFFPSALGLALIGGLILIGSCNKKDPYDLITPGEFVQFVGPSTQVYQMLVNPAPPYTVTVGTTDVSTSARTVTIGVTSNTGAVAGTHYSIPGGNTVTIPAGQATATFTVQGVASQYASGRKDTLKFYLLEPSVKPASFLDTLKLVLRGACAESDLTNATFSGLLGTYTRTYENGTYGPYSSTLTSHTALTPTTSRATLTNIYDSGISAQGVFSYPAAGPFTVLFADQQTQYTVGGLPLFVRSTPATTSTFNYCSQTFTIYFDIYTSAGLYDRWVTTMAR